MPTRRSPMSLEARLDRLHARARASRVLQHLTVTTRLLLAAGFIPPGLTKMLGHRFTSLPVSHPVGYFFDAFFQAPAFYFFVGASQVLSAVLLLFRRTATLGAVLYFPIILNIAVVTVSIGFQGTWVITILMSLACLYLLCWDYDRLKALLPLRPVERPEARLGAVPLAAANLALLGGLAGFLLAARGLLSADVMAPALVLLGAAPVGYALAWWRRRKEGVSVQAA